MISNQITAADWIDKKQKVAEYLHDLTDRAGVPMLVGAILYDHRPGGYSKYNAAILFEPLVRSVQAYNKIHLVPFGEFIPLLDTLPWLTIFTPYRNGYVPSLNFGKDPLILSLGPYRMAIGICFEDTVPHVIRRFFRESESGRQPDMLINLSNDGWFHGSTELDMHLAVSVFRTIEHRVPLARAVNTGISALIDGNGEIRDTLPRLTESVLSVTVPLDDRTSFTRPGETGWEPPALPSPSAWCRWVSSAAGPGWRSEPPRRRGSVGFRPRSQGRGAHGALEFRSNVRSTGARFRLNSR